MIYLLHLSYCFGFLIIFIYFQKFIQFSLAHQNDLIHFIKLLPQFLVSIYFHHFFGNLIKTSIEYSSPFIILLKYHCVV